MKLVGYLFLFFSLSSLAQSQFGRSEIFLREPQTLVSLYDKNSYFVNDTVFTQYQKIEIGIELPTEIAQKVDLFIKTNGEQGTNPYLEWELAVKVIFTHEQTQETDTIDAFYYQNFRRYNNYEGDNLPKPKNGIGYSDKEYQNLGDWELTPTAYQFVARFVAMKFGQWNYQVVIEQGEEHVYFPQKTFVVNENKTNPFIKISPQGRFLEHQNTIFQPIGCNISWPETKMAFDSVFLSYNQWQDDKGVKHVLPENYRRITVAPRVYEKYNEYVLKMNRYGANWFRIIMSPQSSDIEFEELGNYTKRLHQAYELDSLVSLAEANDFFLHWCMQIHYTFKNKVYSITDWDWDDTEGTNVYAYKKAFNLNEPVDFFKSEDAKKYYKQRMRYILSRWGYSSNIGLFEIMSEISNVGSAENESSSFYMNNHQIFEDWQNEMATYFKSNYFGKIHLLTSSYSGLKHVDDDSYFEKEEFDVMSSNMYQFSYEVDANFFTKFVGRIMLNQSNDAQASNYTIKCKDGNCRYIFKPLVFSESEPAQRSAFPQSTIELNRHWWQSYFSGLAFNLSWSQWYTPKNYVMFSKLASFHKHFPLKSDEWHSGFMRIEPFQDNWKWIYDPKSAEWLGNSKTLADLIYLRKNTKDEAIGVITNKTANFITEEQYQVDDYQHPYSEKKIVNLSKEKIRVTDLKKGNYKISYYLPNDFENPVYTQYTSGKILKFNYVNLRNTKDTYILIFRIEPL